MISYGKVRSLARPKNLEVTISSVYLAYNIIPFEEEYDDRILHGYEYDYDKYDKDEYISQLGLENEELKETLLDTQSALCDIYEMIGGLE